MSEEKALNGEIRSIASECVSSRPVMYSIDIESIKTIEDVKILFETLDISILQNLINDKNKHLFKKIEE